MIGVLVTMVTEVSHFSHCSLWPFSDDCPMYCWLTVAHTTIMISYGSTLSTAFLKIVNVL